MGTRVWLLVALCLCLLGHLVVPGEAKRVAGGRPRATGIPSPSPTPSGSASRPAQSPSAQPTNSPGGIPPTSTEWYISPSGSNSNSGQSETSPFLDLQTALSHSQSGDIIHAAAGVYSGPTNVGLVIKDRILMGTGPDTIFQGDNSQSPLSLKGKSLAEVQTMFGETQADFLPDYIFALISKSDNVIPVVQRICLQGSTALILATDSVVINNVYFKQATYGVLSYMNSASYSASIRVIDSLFDTSVDVGALFRGTAATYVSNSQFNGPIGIVLGANQVTEISNCAFYGSENNWAGILYPYHFSQAHDSWSVTGCLFEGYAGGGKFFVGMDGVSMTGITLRHNACYNCSIGDSSNIVVEDNHSPCMMRGDIQNATVSRNLGPVMCGGTATNCAFVSNNAIGNGGAISNTVARSCIFSNNRAIHGGAMYDSQAFDSVFFNNTAVSGGAIYRGSASNCIFTANSAAKYGGAIYDGSSYTSAACLFDGNTAGEAGGGICGGFATIQNFTFIGNRAVRGGGACLSGASGFLDSSFVQNNATYGGGLYLGRASGAEISMSNVLLQRNLASHYGGGMYVGQGSETGTLQNLTVIGNSAKLGGGVYHDVQAYITYQAGDFVDNHAGEGGAMYSVQGYEFRLQQMNFVNNTAGAGGALHMNASNLYDSLSTYSGNKAIQGGALWLAGGVSTSDNATYSANMAQLGGAVWLQNGADATFSSCEFLNNQAVNGTATFCANSSQDYSYSSFTSTSSGLSVECKNCTTSALTGTTNCALSDGLNSMSR